MNAEDISAFQDFLLFLEETDSTNRYLQELSQQKKLNEGTSVFALYQTSGRGLCGNSWESEKGKNILFSSIFYPIVLSASNPFYLSEVASISILQALKEAVEPFDKNAASEFSIKWPNDIYWQEKKMGGILIENTVVNNRIVQSIIGAGVNINQEVFKSSAPNPVSLKQIKGTDSDLRLIFICIIENLYQNYIRILKNDLNLIHSIYMDNLFRKNGLHPFLSKEKEKFYASVKRIEPSGALVLESEDKRERTFMFKEVEFVRDG